MTSPAEIRGDRPGNMPRITRDDLLAIVVLGVLYYAAAKLGLRLAIVERNITPLWPPTGLALLPNLGQPDAAVAEARHGRGDTRRIRVAFSLAEAKADPNARPAFTVDATFGKSLIIVFRTDRPLFDTLRPTTESVASFIQDLGQCCRPGRSGFSR